MAVKVTKPAQEKIKQLERYITKLSWAKDRGFFVKVQHAREKRSDRALVVGVMAKIKSAGKTVRVSFKDGNFYAAIVQASLYAKAIKLAEAQVGTKESPAGSNLQKYGAWYGANGEPWCAIFESWVLSHVGHPFKYAYVPYILNDAKAGKNGLKTITANEVTAYIASGHVVLACYDWPGESPGVPDHTGFVKKMIGPTTFEAIEGNTSSTDAGNQSNGGEVCLKTRSTADVESFVLVS